MHTMKHGSRTDSSEALSQPPRNLLQVVRWCTSCKRKPVTACARPGMRGRVRCLPQRSCVPRPGLVPKHRKTTASVLSVYWTARKKRIHHSFARGVCFYCSNISNISNNSEISNPNGDPRISPDYRRVLAANNTANTYYARNRDSSATVCVAATPLN